MWDLPGPELEPMSPALAGGFLTTAPPGKSLFLWFCEGQRDWLLRPQDEDVGRVAGRLGMQVAAVAGGRDIWGLLAMVSPDCASPSLIAVLITE